MIVDGVILQKTDTARHFGQKILCSIPIFLFWFNLFNVIHFDEWASCCIYVKLSQLLRIKYLFSKFSYSFLNSKISFFS